MQTNFKLYKVDMKYIRPDKALHTVGIKASDIPHKPESSKNL